MRVDIYNFERRLQKTVETINKSVILESNKKLLFEFKSDCITGWNMPKLGPARIDKYLGTIRLMMEMKPDLDWQMIAKSDVKELLSIISEDPKKGAWAEHDYSLALRKFVTWMRQEKGYPARYPDRERLTNLLPLLKYPDEVNGIRLQTSDELPAPEDIPTDAEMKYLCEAAIHPRDKAFIEGATELGPRVGGWGSRQIKHVMFDQLGAKITMTDKTMRNEPVRLVSSAAYLRMWIDRHPFRSDPEAPLWVDIKKIEAGPIAMNYGAIAAMLRRLKKRHNAIAEAKGLPKITKNIRTHIIRYHAQTRDERDGVPPSVMRRQRGWSDQSRQPERYARIANTRVDEYFSQRYGLDKSGPKEDPPSPTQCKRCHEINPPGSVFCYKCGLPMSQKGVQMEEQVFELMSRFMQDKMGKP